MAARRAPCSHVPRRAAYPGGRATGGSGTGRAPGRAVRRTLRAMEVMGVVNVTPYSCSDGGLYLDVDAAVAHGRELLADGASILDIGGESTRPGAAEVPV